MSNTPIAPREHRAPAPENPNYVTGSRKEQVVFYVTATIAAILLLALVVYAYSG